jgi:ribosomal-protein-alanine N-acetyltransferase
MIYELDNQFFVRTLKLEDVTASYPLWFQDQLVTKFNSHGKFTKTLEYFKEYYGSLDQEGQLVWAICHVEDGHVGNISLQLINSINRNADFGILIGNKKHWGKGLALKASKVLLQHGFYKLNLKRIYCSTADTNHAMKKLAINMGMSEEGRCRSHIYLEGQWVDMIRYGILRSECPQIFKDN